MPAFTYRVRRGEAETIDGVVEAADRNEAIARLKRMGYFLLSVDEARGDLSDVARGTLLRRISRQEIAVCIGQLASLLKAGLSLAVALKSLQEQTAGTPLSAVLERIHTDVSEGATLCESMRKFPRLFPPTQTASVRAGEEGGMLAEVLGRLASQLKAELEIRGRIKGAMAYPIFLLLLGTLTVMVLLTFVIPRFTLLFATMGEQLPLPTRILLGFSAFMDHRWPAVLVSLGMGVLLTILAFRQESTRAAFDRWLLAAPMVGSIISRSETARFARTLSELLGSGVPVLMGLQITRDVLKNRCFRRDVDQLRAAVGRGSAIATALRRLPSFGPLIVNMVAVGEQSGQLSELLLEVADLYEKECERAIQAFTTILGPSLIVVLGGIIAFVISAILLPVFQASTMAG
ncbi:MAG TPA: type II secretion system F family protein [Phycisphaerae bacterium]|nr:type II secretion system F family protein [Phycisphaerae bacterium]